MSNDIYLEEKFVSKSDWNADAFWPKAFSGWYVLLHGDCGLLIYNYAIWRHIPILTLEIRFPKFCWSFQSAQNVLLHEDILWRSRTRSFMLINVV